MKLRKLKMDKYVTKVTYLLRYVPYIKEEKAKVKCFLSSLPTYMKEIIEFGSPKTMLECVINK